MSAAACVGEDYCGYCAEESLDEDCKSGDDKVRCWRCDGVGVCANADGLGRALLACSSCKGNGYLRRDGFWMPGDKS